MELFKKNNRYRILIREPKIKIYTALILNEDESFVRFKDINNEEIILKKEDISEIKWLE